MAVVGGPGALILLQRPSDRCDFIGYVVISSYLRCEARGGSLCFTFSRSGGSQLLSLTATESHVLEATA